MWWIKRESSQTLVSSSSATLRFATSSSRLVSLSTWDFRTLVVQVTSQNFKIIDFGNSFSVSSLSLSASSDYSCGLVLEHSAIKIVDSF